MAGIYIHIPFCKTRCHYCDFFSCTKQDEISPIINSIIKEIELKKEYLAGETVETIYFGGGTPSFISPKFIAKLLNSIYTFYSVVKFPEITIEVNPDDITKESVKDYNSIGINRISIGAQSFDDNILKFLGRRHNSKQIFNTVEIFKKTGFHNIGLDLIYGIPSLSIKEWKYAIEQIIKLDVQHISAYHLTIEKGTLMHKLLIENKIHISPDEESLKQYLILTEKLQKSGYSHYEISNFSKPGLESKHNSSYWFGKKYAGFGPSAHSFDGNSRQWNISNTQQYANRIENNGIYFKKEILSSKNKYNEYILTRLRTVHGVFLKEISILFGDKYLQYFTTVTKKHLIQNNLIQLNNEQFIIPENKWFISDAIISDLLKA